MIFIILWMAKLMVQNLTLIKIAQSFGINIVLILAFINIILRHIALLCAEKSFHCTLRFSFCFHKSKFRMLTLRCYHLVNSRYHFILKTCKRNEIMLRNVARHYHQIEDSTLLLLNNTHNLLQKGQQTLSLHISMDFKKSLFYLVLYLRLCFHSRNVAKLQLYKNIYELEKKNV